MFCTSCGAELPEGARFCSKCGAKVTPPVRAGADGGTEDGAERRALSDTGRNPDIDAPIPADVAGSAASSRPDIADDGEGPAVDDGTVPGKSSDEEAEAGVEPVGPIDETPDAAKPFAKKAAATHKRRGFAATMIQFRRTTLRAVPTFVLAIIAFLAAAATAYALFRVATDIIIPAIEQAQQVEEKEEANEAEGSGESGAEASDNESKEDAEKKEEVSFTADSKPDNFLQIGKLISMDPKEIPGYLESQGLQMEEIGDLTSAYAKSLPAAPENGGVHWKASRDVLRQIIPEDLQGGGSGDNVIIGADEFDIAMGSSLPLSPFNHSEAEQYSTVEMLNGGERPIDLGITNLPLKFLDDAGVESFANAFGFDKPVAVYTVTTTNTWDHVPVTSRFSVGFFKSSGTEMMWLLEQSQTEGSEDVSSTFSCHSADRVRSFVDSVMLYTDEEIDVATEKQRAYMIAQSIAEENTLATNQDGSRINLRIKEPQASKYENSTNIWMTMDDYYQSTGDTGVSVPQADQFTADSYLDATKL